MQTSSIPAVLAFFLSVAFVTPEVSAAPVRLSIEVRDQGGQPLPCRIHLMDEQGAAQRAPDLPFWRDHFVCPGTAT